MKVNSFHEKPGGDGAVVNGGFFVLSPSVIDYIADETTFWEKSRLESLAEEGKLAAFQHTDFGSQWILCEISSILRSCGKQDQPRGKCGNESPILAGQDSSIYRAYWF